MALGWLWWPAWAPLVARGTAALCVAGVALGDIHLHFAWQAWRLAICTQHSRGRRGAYDTGLAARLGAVGRCGAIWRHGRSICMAGVALMHRAGSGGALGRRRRWSLWRRGTVAGVALGNMDVAFAWQAQALVARWGAVGRPWRRGTFHNRQGAWRHPPVAGVALGDMDTAFARQAWHLWHWAGSGGALRPVSRPGRRCTLHGRRGAW